MKKVLLVGCLCLAVSAGFILSGCDKGDGQAQAGTQTTCPVMKGPIDKNIYEDYEGKRVYFCCEGCKTTFKAAPEKVMKTLDEAGVTLEEMP